MNYLGESNLKNLKIEDTDIVTSPPPAYPQQHELSIAGDFLRYKVKEHIKLSQNKANKEVEINITEEQVKANVGANLKKLGINHGLSIAEGKTA